VRSGWLRGSVNNLGVRGFPVGRLDRLYFSPTSPDYFGGHGEAHGPIRVHPVINKDKPFTSKIFAAFFCWG
jgi:hypothetical protein